MAVEFVNATSRPVFLTGKAGTGKTTFLKYIKEHTPKKCVVVAPTGVAAINAGGVTMHSFFQLPLGPYVPVTQRHVEAGFTDKHTLFKNIRISTEKRELMRDLELIIIDEVSMVRSDTLDAMDAILRYFRKKPDRVFGGVQILFIGDLFQLPPVMPDHEWSVLKAHYESPFFFHSQALNQVRPVYIELKKIYRQSDQHFIDILNRVRNNAAVHQDFDVLNGHYQLPPIDGKKYITLTSHNYKADKINQEQLQKLSGKLFEFKGTIDGDFSDKALPTEMVLQVKVGAQVMFIRNDTSEDRRYFNGKIVTVSKIDEAGIRVFLDGSKEEFLLEKDTWNNIKYSYNQADEKIEEEKLGSFSQYPIRLAWAITIHKSQGLTFENAIIDAGDSFAPGQVYVALSRCTSLEGLILHSKIHQKSISTDERVLSFVKQEIHPEGLSAILHEEKQVFLNEILLETFQIDKLIETLDAYSKYVLGKKLPDLQGAVTNANTILNNAYEIQKVSLKFSDQLSALLRENKLDLLKERVSKAIDYFSKALVETVLQPLDKHIESLKGVAKVKKYLKQARLVRMSVTKKIESIQNTNYGEITFEVSKVMLPQNDDQTAVLKKAKAEKGESMRETLDLFQSGLSIQDIAAKRGLALSTVESHISTLVRMGEIDIHKVVTEERLKKILEAISKAEPPSLTMVKLKLDENFSYGEIRAVFKHLEFKQNEKYKD